MSGDRRSEDGIEFMNVSKRIVLVAAVSVMAALGTTTTASAGSTWDRVESACLWCHLWR